MKRSKKRRLWILAAVLLPLSALAGYRWIDGRPLRAVARDYLSYRRVLTYREVILEAAEESRVDPDLLAAIMVAESSGKLDAVSPKDALGLFQLSQGTAEWRAESLGLPKPTREQLLSDPLLNARLGADTMAWLLKTYDDDELRSLCTYNAGWGTMGRLTAKAGGWEAWRRHGELNRRSEILAYAKKVLRYRDVFRMRGIFRETPAPSGSVDSTGSPGTASPDTAHEQRAR